MIILIIYNTVLHILYIMIIHILLLYLHQTESKFVCDSRSYVSFY